MDPLTLAAEPCLCKALEVAKLPGRVLIGERAAGDHTLKATRTRMLEAEEAWLAAACCSSLSRSRCTKQARGQSRQMTCMRS